MSFTTLALGLLTTTLLMIVLGWALDLVREGGRHASRDDVVAPRSLK
jgi:hypothetical protein